MIEYIRKLGSLCFFNLLMPISHLAHNKQHSIFTEIFGQWVPSFVRTFYSALGQAQWEIALLILIKRLVRNWQLVQPRKTAGLSRIKGDLSICCPLLKDFFVYPFFI